MLKEDVVTENQPEAQTEKTIAMPAAQAVGGEPTQIMAPVEPSIRDRAAEREERNKRLGVVAPAPAPMAAFSDHELAKPKRTTDRWNGALSFTVLRLVTAAILGVRGWQHLTDLAATNQMFANSILPQSNYWGWGLGIAEIVAAVFFLLGFATRFAGILLMAIEVGMLVFFLWGKKNPFQAGQMGFVGELELLLAAVGLVFLFLGSGGWAFDAMFRNRRAERKAAKLSGDYL